MRISEPLNETRAGLGILAGNDRLGSVWMKRGAGVRVAPNDVGDMGSAVG